MTKESFLKNKGKLIILTTEYLAKPELTQKEREDLHLILAILKEDYFFENRLDVKGTLSHTISDTMDFHNYLTDELIAFDKMIN